LKVWHANIMRSFRIYFCFFLLGIFAATTAFAKTPPGGSVLRMGIVPLNSPAALFKIHQPLVRHLTKAVRRPIRFYTATDHAAFYREATAGAYDLMIVSPHLVPFLLKQGFVPLARCRSEMDVVLVLPSDRTFNSLEDLRGKRIGLPDQLAFITINGIRWFGSQGMAVNRDFYVEWQPNLAATLMAVALGKLDMTISAQTSFKMLPADLSARVKTYKLSEQPQPSLMILAKTSLGQVNLKRLQAGLDSFPSTPKGQSFFRETGYIGFVPVTQEDLDALSIYEDITEQMLEQSGTTFVGDAKKGS